MNYKEKIESFRSSCRVYKREKDRYETLLDENKDNPSYLQYLEYIKEDIDFVEKSLTKVEELCGPNARVLIWDLYIENKTQQTVAQEYGMTRRQLQHSLDKWQHAVFDDKQA